MLAGDFLHDGQTQAAAAQGDRVGPVKALKHMGLVARRNAHTRVLNLQPARTHPHRHRHAATGMHQRVIHQVAQGLLHQQGHAHHLALSNRGFKTQVMLMGLRLVPHGLRHLARQRHQRHLLRHLHIRGVFGPGERQQLFSQMHRLVGGEHSRTHRRVSVWLRNLALGQCQLRFEHSQRRAQLVRCVV